MKRFAFFALAILIVSYVALCVLVYTQQRKILFPVPPVQAVPLGSTVIDVPGGTKILWRAAGPTGPVVVHFHGNAEQLSSEAWLSDAYAGQNVSFAAVEYPGYSGLPGEPSEASLLAAAQAALEHLTGPMGIAKERIVLSGQSVGTGVAVAMAAQGWGTRLLLLSPYTSLPDVGAKVFPWLPVRVLMKDRFDSAAKAPQVRIPVMILHGTLDEVIPFALGQDLSTKFPSARFVPVPDSHHNDLWDSLIVAGVVMRFVAGN